MSEVEANLDIGLACDHFISLLFSIPNSYMLDHPSALIEKR